MLLFPNNYIDSEGWYYRNNNLELSFEEFTNICISVFNEQQVENQIIVDSIVKKTRRYQKLTQKSTVRRKESKIYDKMNCAKLAQKVLQSWIHLKKSL